MELDVPPVSLPVLGVGADPPARTFSTAVTLPDAGATAAGSPAGAWEAGGAILAAAGSGPPAPPSADSCCLEPDPSVGLVSGGGGVALGAAEEEALANR
jgi:hypothetical protein